MSVPVFRSAFFFLFVFGPCTLNGTAIKITETRAVAVQWPLTYHQNQESFPVFRLIFIITIARI